MDHGITGKRIHMYSNKKEIEQNTHQERRRTHEEHTWKCTGRIIVFVTGNRVYIFVCSYIECVTECIQVENRNQ